MKTKFDGYTPGPWLPSYSKDYFNGTSVVRAKKESGLVVCACTHIEASTLAFGSSKDNASLIAAAPDLLTTLVKAYEFMKAHEWDAQEENRAFLEDCCLVCNNFRSEKHESDCELTSLLREIEGVLGIKEAKRG